MSAAEGPYAWGDRQITLEEARSFADTLQLSPDERDIVARFFAEVPVTLKMRGMFFSGLTDVVQKLCGRDETLNLLAITAAPARTTAFINYSLRDFYKFYMAAARRIHPTKTLPEGMHELALLFYPIFRESAIGKTMSVFMGKDPASILKLLPKAYNTSVEGVDHMCEIGDREATWRSKSEPFDYYPSVFSGVVEGAMRSHGAQSVAVKQAERLKDDNMHSYVFRISW